MRPHPSLATAPAQRRGLTTRRAVIAASAAGLLAGVLAVPQAVLAAPTPLTDVSSVQALAAELGDDRTGGVYLDATGRLVIGVTDDAAARTVRAAGGVAEVVKYSTAALSSIHTTFDERVAAAKSIPNTSWGVDPSTNQVVVEIFDGVSGADEKRLRELGANYGDAVRVERLSGSLQPMEVQTRGGIGIYPDGGNRDFPCTLGFNVRNDAGKKYFVTAGHCAGGSNEQFWNRLYGDFYLGKRIWYDYGGDQKDYAVMEYRNENVVAYGAVTAFDTNYEITDSRYPNDGESVKRAGTISSYLDGAVLSPSETVTFNDGITLKNMIKTSLCGMEGDSGGPLWSGTYALGILAGGSDVAECRSSTAARTWYQPVHWVMTNYGLHAF